MDNRVRIPVEGVRLEGNLDVPAEAKGVIVFAHGSGSSRHSPRNQFVAKTLREGGFGTLLMDLLTVQEEHLDQLTQRLRFDINMLSKRLIGTIDWLKEQHGIAQIGLFGSSTGAGAALIAAAARPVQAVVSRSGRPDLAGAALLKVQAPTLLIVGGEDTPVIQLNQQALGQLEAVKEMVLVPGATHLFEEPGTLEQAANLAQKWFETHLVIP